MEKKKVLVSACLLGEACRYDGKSKPCERVIALFEKYELIAVCPECEGGLPTPRAPSEICLDRVINREGVDVTDNYRKGAECALQVCRENGITLAILKSRSPSCGKGQIYDGSFSGRLISGNGTAADLLIKNGITVLTEEEI